MSTLLEQAIQAHGGIENWNRFRTVSAELDIGGAVWHLKEQPGLFHGIELVANLWHQHVAIASPAGGWRGTFEPDIVAIDTVTGETLETRHAPRDAYRGHTQQTRWDRLHALYFTGYALWTYLTIPFLYAGPGFHTEELPDWHENGETWRRLKVTFPDAIASHSREQVSYFGEDGLLRRHDYTVDVMGGARGANYASGYRNVRGVMVPMSRRVFAYDDAAHKIDELLLVSIDIRSIDFHTE
ncbi:hypothetical protein [Burkholderia ubonensis]|uniref:hypothetical protein n=1 Tax=Burkholderia ubonensis TaxID=101571 RepID=UPI00076DF076|nr:hypothetical protein [Burkholderia ubonensis]KVS39923.1 hypothetical protein WK38_03290 [Burkholderia ubonensis]KVS48018.1 hypothetical protein WK37_08220 [Burkholderia ubonensis]KVS78752.1 hypothetical protein WK42_15950 [Burkholderia ubonensis]KVS93447.1 hypothetical protein WK44_11195 [Burkholderia ubonensis]KVS94192.1 hypothetical protein WK43_09695 [Burkholderia ubonensis]